MSNKTNILEPNFIVDYRQFFKSFFFKYVHLQMDFYNKGNFRTL